MLRSTDECKRHSKYEAGFNPFNKSFPDFLAIPPDKEIGVSEIQHESITDSVGGPA